MTPLYSDRELAGITTVAIMLALVTFALGVIAGYILKTTEVTPWQKKPPSCDSTPKAARLFVIPNPTKQTSPKRYVG